MTHARTLLGLAVGAAVLIALPLGSANDRLLTWVATGVVAEARLSAYT